MSANVRMLSAADVPSSEALVLAKFANTLPETTGMSPTATTTAKIAR